MVDQRSKRLPSAERSASILDAAEIVFGSKGYAAATTDAIAVRAGISQAYVVRTFGSKERLFTSTAERAFERVFSAFRRGIERAEAEGSERVEPFLGAEYAQLVRDKGTLPLLLHLFAMGQDPVVGPLARAGFLEGYRILREEAGMSAPAATAFMANGSMVNVLLGLHLPQSEAGTPAVDELVEATFRENVPLVRRIWAEDEPERSGWLPGR